MRFFDLSATALAAAAMLSGVSADAPPSYVATSLDVEPIVSGSATATATTTYYVTRTVLRVVETVTSTGDGTSSAYTTTEASTAAVSTVAPSSTVEPSSTGEPSSTVKPSPSHYPGLNTTIVYGSGIGTGGMPMATYVSPPPSTGAAGKLEAFTFAAVLGLVALVL
ncbi:hypothetical protein TI39_contig332g00001 [Zymoseptoria brevis]|uniref:Uncharacterized protein n=1 Tax=Zymoseptoria brevis TaxID=1047168 RepID=A0A0F4GT03_9PEZI|nr:hypothetical protein TI39_contig332g00001 [Zymoseptoria brevis]